LAQHARIVLDDFEVALHSPDQIAPVGVLHPTKFHLEFKDASSAEFSPDLASLVFEVTDAIAPEETVMCGEEHAALESANIGDVQLTVNTSSQHDIVTMGCWRQERAGLGELGLCLFVLLDEVLILDFPVQRQYLNFVEGDSALESMKICCICKGSQLDSQSF